MGYYTKYKREKDLKAFSTNPLRTLSSDTFSHREEKKNIDLYTINAIGSRQTAN